MCRFMQAGVKRQRRAELRRHAILDAALGLIAERGVGNVTHRAVAAAAGVPLAATTYYFASKSALLGEAFQLHSERLTARVAAVEARVLASGPTAERIAKALAAVLSEELGRGRVELVAEYELILEAQRRSELARLPRALDTELAKRLHGWLEAVGSRDADADTALVMAAVAGLEVRGLVGAKRVGRATLERRLLRLLNALLGA